MRGVAAIVMAIVCAVLATSLTFSLFYYSNVLSQQNQHIATLEQTVDGLAANLTDAEATIAGLNVQIQSDNASITSLEDKLAAADDLTAILMGAINGDNAGALKTVAVHVSFKGDGYEWGNTANVSETYNKIQNLTNYQVLVLPEFEGNTNSTALLAWLANNLTDIPLILPVFEGGTQSAPTLKLNAEEIRQAIAADDVRMVRLQEIVSWYGDNNQSFPTEYVKSILGFCRQNNLGVMWNEWKTEAFATVKDCIAGYEDMVTVMYQTNDEFHEPVEGYMAVSNLFEHWGASVQPWYWTTRYNVEPTNMPVSLLAWHAVLAKNMGAEIIQFEPSWCFFDNNGEPMESMEVLGKMVR